MNKEQLVKAVADRTGYSQRQVREVIGATLEAIENSLRKGEPVQLVGFGSFVIISRKERRGRNPRTGEPMIIPGRRVVRFRPGKRLQDAVQ